ncbi:MAG TPA: alkaline phosphatase D family protein [Polyangiaceae bacterium]|nr:alkaline phosphatase D family protein [Polyangiaceae bacterium]
MNSTEATVSAEQFRRAFVLDPNPWPGSSADRALLQLGMPHAHGLSLWLAPERGGALQPTIALPGQPAAQTQLVKLGASGVMRADISGLSPGTTYEVAVRLSPQAPTRIVRASTAPAASNEPFSFLAASCFSPFAARQTLSDSLLELRVPKLNGFEFPGPFVAERTAHVLELLEQRALAPAPLRPSFFLGLGDQIYVDTGARIGQSMLAGARSDRQRYAPGELREFYETVYRATFSLEPFAAALAALPSALMWDDHEIRDGWGSQGDENAHGGDWRPHLQAARDYYVAWQGARNPPRAPNGGTLGEYRGLMQVGPDLTRSRELDFRFDWGSQATFFVMDLRSYRNSSENRVVSEEQLLRLEQWLGSRRADVPTVFVLGSPLPLCQAPRLFDRFQERYVPSRRDDMTDAWWSPPLSQQHLRVLGTLRQHFSAHPLHRLVILSGDVHFSELLELTDEQGRVFGHEIISSGLSQTFFKILRTTTQKDSQLPGGVRARGIGRFHGPAFAEVFVTPDERAVRPPRVDVTFHASVTASGATLANVHGPSAKRLELPLSRLPVSLFRLSSLFDRFIEPDLHGRDPTAVAQPR